MIGAVLAASDAPVYISAAGALLVAISTAAGFIATRRSSKVATDVAVIEATQQVSKEAIEFLRRDAAEKQTAIDKLRGKVDALEAQLERCEDERRKLTAEVVALKGPQ